MLLTPKIMFGVTERELTAYSIIAVAILIVLLVSKELTGASERPRFKLLGKYLNVGIILLLSVLAFIVIMKVLEIIGNRESL